MKILVCFKAVKDPDYVLKNDWNDVANCVMDWSYVRSIFSCYDEGALENALVLKDSLKSDVVLDAISITEFDCSLFNELLLSAGYDNVVNLKTECSHFSPNKNAKTIFNYIKDKEYDIIITGVENATGNNGTFYYKLASLLNYDVLTDVSKLIFENNKLIAETDTLAEVVTYEGKTKAIYAFKNTENAYLRFPTLMDRLKAKNKKAIILDASDYLDKDQTYDVPITKMYYKEDKLETKFIDGTTNEKVNYLLAKEVINE